MNTEMGDAFHGIFEKRSEDIHREAGDIHVEVRRTNIIEDSGEE